MFPKLEYCPRSIQPGIYFHNMDSNLVIGRTYFLSKPKNIRSLDESSCNWVSGGTLVGVLRVGVLGLEFGVEVAGVAKGVFEVDVMILSGFWVGREVRSCAAAQLYAVKSEQTLSVGGANGSSGAGRE